MKYCIDHEKDYKHTAVVFDVSYAQVYSWVKKYLENGAEVLFDKRGKRKDESDLTELEQSQRKIKIPKSFEKLYLSVYLDLYDRSVIFRKKDCVINSDIEMEELVRDKIKSNYGDLPYWIQTQLNFLI